MRKGFRRVEFVYLLANVVLFVVLLYRLSYGDGSTSVGRIATAVILAAVLRIPWVWVVGRTARRALVVSFAVGLSMLPVPERSTRTGSSSCGHPVQPGRDRSAHEPPRDRPPYGVDGHVPRPVPRPWPLAGAGIPLM